MDAKPIHGIIATVALLTAGSAFATALPVEVASGVQENFTPAQLSAIATGQYDEIVKTGKGTLKITSAATISDFAGRITIQEGVYDVAISSGALGQTGYNAATSTSVGKGAALQFSHSDKSATAYVREFIYIEGDGPSDAAYPGAIVRMGRVVYLGRVVLTDDASIGGNDMLHVDDNYSIDLAQHTLTVRKGLSFGGAGVLNPGKIVVAGGDVYLPTAASKFPDWSGQELHFGSGVTIKCIVPQTEALGCTFVMDGNVTIDVPKGKGCTALALHNDIVLNNGATLTWNIQNLERVDMYGSISGDGSVVKSANASFPSALWLHGVNTYTGTTTIPKGGDMDVIVAMKPTSVPGWADGRADGAFAEAGTGLGFGLESERNVGGWSMTDINACLARAVGKNSRFYLAVDAGDTATVAGDLALSSPPFFGTIGGGTARMTGLFGQNKPFYFFPFKDTDEFVVTRTEGDVRVNEPSTVKLYGGTLRFKDAVNINHYGLNNVFWVGEVEESTPRVIFEGRTAYYNYYRMTIPERQDCRGVVEVRDDAGVTNTCLYGNVQGGVGCTYQSGGTYVPADGSVFGNDVKAEGYLEVSGGATVFPGNAMFGQHSGATAATANLSAGLLYQSGGSVRQTDKDTKGLGFGAGGHGVYYLTGGTYTGINAIYLPRARTVTDYTAGSGNLTVSGPDAKLEITSSGVYLCDRDSSEGFLNLMNGGTVSALQVVKPTKTSVGGVALDADRRAYLGFNGGVLMAEKTRDYLIGSNGPDYLTVYAGGAIVDTAGHDVGIAMPLTAPQGAGIVAIALPNGLLTGYVAPPLVTIAGAGQGASAVAEFDSASGTVTGVTVTSPGWGYAAETTTVTLSRGGKKDVVVCTATVAADAGTGGLTKRGEGTLTLLEDNSYTGPTVVEAGRLRIKSHGAIPADSEVVIKGGTLEIGTGLMPANWRVEMDGAALDKTQRYTLVEITSVTAGAVPTLPSSVPENWHARIVGKKVVLKYNFGTVLIVR